ncbi:MAG: hypothetical protein U1F76_31210 [Candidatus Competibacteraceae bacterium]
MHDGVFRKRDLRKLDRELAERLENPEIYADDQVAESLDRALAPDCELHPVFRLENLPQDLWVRETLIARARTERLNPYNAAILRQLACGDWDTANYPAALRAAKQAAWEERVAAKCRCLEAKARPGCPLKDLRAAMRRLDRAANNLQARGPSDRPVDPAIRKTPRISKRLDVDAPIEGARPHAP